MPPVQRRHTFSIGYFVLVALALVWLQSILAPQMRQIPYSEFKQHARQGLGREGACSPTRSSAASSSPSTRASRSAFVTVRVADDQLVPELAAEGRRSSRGSTRARS